MFRCLNSEFLVRVSTFPKGCVAEDRSLKEEDHVSVICRNLVLQHPRQLEEDFGVYKAGTNQRHHPRPTHQRSQHEAGHVEVWKSGIQG